MCAKRPSRFSLALKGLWKYKSVEIFFHPTGTKLVNIPSVLIQSRQVIDQSVRSTQGLSAVLLKEAVQWDVVPCDVAGYREDIIRPHSTTSDVHG